MLVPQDLLHFIKARRPEPEKSRKIRQSDGSTYLELIRRCRAPGTPYVAVRPAGRRPQSTGLGIWGTGFWFYMCDPWSIISPL